MLDSQLYLMHYGIKGQQWGLRRFQNEDGTLTREGKDRYGIGEKYGQRTLSKDKLRQRYKRDRTELSSYASYLDKEKKSKTFVKSKRRQQLEKKFLDKGFTKEQAEVKAYRTEQTEKLLKVVGAVALTAGVAYGAYKGSQFISRYKDVTISKGTVIQRVTENANDITLNRPMYISPNKKDFVKYRGLFGKQITDAQDARQWINLFGNNNNSVSNGVYRVNAEAGSKLKIAGERAGNKTFKDLIKNDSEFRKDVENAFGIKPEKILNSKGSKDYDVFNKDLAGGFMGERSNRMREKFFNALKSKGYNGVIDVNDRRFSGYHAKNPTILFDVQNKLKNISASKMARTDIAKDYSTAYKKVIAQAKRDKSLDKIFKSVRDISIYTGVNGTIAGVGSYVGNNIMDNRNGAHYRALINQYKKEHPILN